MTSRPELSVPLPSVPAFSALIFDMDGLLVDSEPVWWSVETAYAAKRGQQWTDEQARRCVGKGLGYVVDRMNELYGFGVETSAGVHELHQGFSERVPELKLMPGVTELLEAATARKLPMAVASSSSQSLIDKVMAHVGLTSQFRLTMSGEAVARPKPAPDLFLAVAKRLEVAPAQCVVFEDSLAGTQAGHDADMIVVAVPDEATDAFRQLTPQVMNDLHEAKAWLGL